MTEQWLPVVGWEGIYWVSDHGRIRSADRTVPARYGGVRRVTGRTLKAFPTPSGHLMVDLVDGQRRQRAARVHRLVLEAFVGPCPPGMEALHWDDNAANNNLANLRYGTRTENMLDMVRNGRHWGAKKTHCKRGHEFTPENVLPRGNGNQRECRACIPVRRREAAAAGRSA